MRVFIIRDPSHANLLIRARRVAHLDQGLQFGGFKHGQHALKINVPLEHIDEAIEMTRKGYEAK